MFGNLFIKPVIATTLPEFGKTVCSELGIVEFTERESSNYLNGHYLTARCLGVIINFALTDDDDFSEYPFWINMKTDGFWIEQGDVFEGLADLLARKLTLAGYAVARCPDNGRVGADIWRYSLKSDSGGTARGEIQIEILKPPTLGSPNSSNP